MIHFLNRICICQPWPYPSQSVTLPAIIPPAFWHREGYTAIILKFSDVLSAFTPEKQETQIRSSRSGNFGQSRTAIRFIDSFMPIDGLTMLSFAELRLRWPWKPIRNCPGRFVLDRDHTHLSLSMLLDSQIQSNIFHSSMTPDPIQVVRLEDGGIISYARPDGSLVHTLNTQEGFARKLQQLGIRV